MARPVQLRCRQRHAASSALDRAARHRRGPPCREGDPLTRPFSLGVGGGARFGAVRCSVLTEQRTAWRGRGGRISAGERLAADLHYVLATAVAMSVIWWALSEVVLGRVDNVQPEDVPDLCE